MRITNKYLVSFIAWLFRLEMKKVHFVYIKEIYDEDVSTLAFLNQVKGEFNERVEEFRDELEGEIKKAVEND